MSEPDLRAWIKTLARRACPTCHGNGYLGLTAVKCYTCPTVEAKICEAFTYTARRARQQATEKRRLATASQGKGFWGAARGYDEQASALEYFAKDLEALGQGGGET